MSGEIVRSFRSRPSRLHSRAQRYAIASAMQLAIDIVAAVGIINPVAVADVEPVLGAVPPDRVLHEPREGLRESRVELAGINSHGDRLG